MKALYILPVVLLVGLIGFDQYHGGMLRDKRQQENRMRDFAAPVITEDSIESVGDSKRDLERCAQTYTEVEGDTCDKILSIYESTWIDSVASPGLGDQKP